MLVYIPLFIVTVTLAGTFMTYIRYATGSIWTSIVAHTAHNLAWNYGMIFTRESKPIATYITGDAGIVLIVFYLAVFIWIIRRNKRQELL